MDMHEMEALRKIIKEAMQEFMDEREYEDAEVDKMEDESYVDEDESYVDEDEDEDYYDDYDDIMEDEEFLETMASDKPKKKKNKGMSISMVEIVPKRKGK